MIIYLFIGIGINIDNESEILSCLTTYDCQETVAHAKMIDGNTWTFHSKELLFFFIYLMFVFDS